ncbi:hypothetical protein [Phorcysia thermohydrogeniphila]|uniref:Uncharacterized protein n=1 Tax=Phorcysia thermohydrogeniphila TaxID=936138 RepID=A0A4V2PDT0_9BACT|nr:hypothetical protein [Phorcysia thermohydrogeniphila]TCK06476.1 hypothetical protein CLV27_0277 [Phorcysia thermohydrogeniphila]
MRLLLGALFALLVPLSAVHAQTDPFADPVRSAVKKRLASMAAQGQKVVLNKPVTVNRFEPVLPESLDSYTVEGIIGSKGSYRLIVTDPTTGRTFFLKEGDAVAPDTVIKRITFDTVILTKYVMEGGKIKKETVTLKVDTEG